MKQTSEPEERSSVVGNEETLLTLEEELSIVSMGFKAIFGNEHPVVTCSKEGSYRIILAPAFSMSAKIISGWVNIRGSSWGMYDALASAIAYTKS